MISYAQNAEDVVLRRAFSESSDGFYIDIGASDPLLDSVTAFFYFNGWRGINVEPDAAMFDSLNSARPGDVNIRAAVTRAAGTITFYPTGTRGHGTLVRALAATRIQGSTAEEVCTVTLAEIFDRHAAGREVAFLKIDVEGAELDVIASGDWTRHRPKVVVVEAVDEAGRPTHDAWEPILTAAAYEFCFFDGLNRFYCRREDAEALRPLLAVPANVLDNWRAYREIYALNDAIASLRKETSDLVAAFENERSRLQSDLALALSRPRIDLSNRSDARSPIPHDVDHARWPGGTREPIDSKAAAPLPASATGRPPRSSADPILAVCGRTTSEIVGRIAFQRASIRPSDADARLRTACLDGAFGARLKRPSARSAREAFRRWRDRFRSRSCPSDR
ncbi:hypothetical protein CH340_01210 [Rhodoplanes serenus]|nr:hypothetical protein CH340_01210 [Rhodoplanes serenus]